MVEVKEQSFVGGLFNFLIKHQGSLKRSHLYYIRLVLTLLTHQQVATDRLDHLGPFRVYGEITSIKNTMIYRSGCSLTPPIVRARTAPGRHLNSFEKNETTEEAKGVGC